MVIPEIPVIDFNELNRRPSASSAAAVPASGAALFGDGLNASERQNKMLRLLGGSKKGNEHAAKEMLSKMSAVNAERAKVADELEKQFTDAVSHKRVLGAGQQAPPKK